LYDKFRKDLLDAKPIHFDRWLSRVPYVIRPYAPKTHCEELTRHSATLGKLRVGLDHRIKMAHEGLLSYDTEIYNINKPSDLKRLKDLGLKIKTIKPPPGSQFKPFKVASKIKKS